jgi:hypothetical protein
MDLSFYYIVYYFLYLFKLFNWRYNSIGDNGASSLSDSISALSSCPLTNFSIDLE